VVVAHPVDAQRLGVVVVEGEVHALAVGEVRGDVVGAQLDLAVLDVLGVHELDRIEHVHLLEQGRADEPVEVAARHEPIPLCLELRHGHSIGTEPRN
jgi:hypothetical protein